MFRKLSAALFVGLVAAAAPLAAQAGIGVVGGFVSANVTSDPNPVGTHGPGVTGRPDARGPAEVAAMRTPARFRLAAGPRRVSFAGAAHHARQ